MIIDWLSFGLGLIAGMILLFGILYIIVIVKRINDQKRDEEKAKKIEEQLKGFKEQLEQQHETIKEQLEKLKGMKK